MILVNLLPHRQRRRQERRRSFYVGLVASAALGLALVLAVQQGLDGLVRAQSARNATLDAGIARLDTQLRDIAALRREEGLGLPADLDYGAMPSLSAELRQKLLAVRPLTLGQASRIDGMTPAALAVILGHVKRRDRKNAA